MGAQERRDGGHKDQDENVVHAVIIFEQMSFIHQPVVQAATGN